MQGSLLFHLSFSLICFPFYVFSNSRVLYWVVQEVLIAKVNSLSSLTYCQHVALLRNPSETLHLEMYFTHLLHLLLLLPLIFLPNTWMNLLRPSPSRSFLLVNVLSYKEILANGYIQLNDSYLWSSFSTKLVYEIAIWNFPFIYLLDRNFELYMSETEL